MLKNKVSTRDELAIFSVICLIFQGPIENVDNKERIRFNYNISKSSLQQMFTPFNMALASAILLLQCP